MAISVACSSCGFKYSLKDEFAGKMVRCAKCEEVIQVGHPPVAAAPLATGQAAGMAGASGVRGDPVFDRDRFLLRQKHLSISEKYVVSDDQGRAILFVLRPSHLLRNLGALFGAIAATGLMAVLLSTVGSLLPKSVNTPLMVLLVLALFPTFIVVAMLLSPLRHVTFFRDESQRERLLEVQQLNKIMFPSAFFSVRDAAGNELARLNKNYLFDIFRKQWLCTQPGGKPICLAKEDSIILSLLRRLLGPLFGVLRTNFIFVRPDGDEDRILGEFNRKFTLLDRYVLDLTADRNRELDRRVAVALGVMLDTGERR
jgi:uncharacterized protein YxjI